VNRCLICDKERDGYCIHPFVMHDDGILRPRATPYGTSDIRKPPVPIWRTTAGAQGICALAFVAICLIGIVLGY